MAKKLRFYVSTLHELCHVWFGNLITIKWWCDIGLDEAFATYMSFLVMSKSPKLARFHDSCWVTFLEYKFWGVSRDSLSQTTHPVCCHVEDTCKAEALYDGIAYGKGPAFVKQLFFLMGYERVRAGLRLYFKRYAWKNGSLEAFTNCMQEAYTEGRDKNLDSSCNYSGINGILPEGFDMAQWCKD